MSQPGSNVAPSKEVETVDATTLARLAADAIADKKGQDVVLLEVGDLFVITDVFVIATGNSRPHVQSLVDRVEESLKDDAGRKPLRAAIGSFPVPPTFTARSSATYFAMNYRAASLSRT